MVYEELNSQITDLRCDLEELAEQVRQIWTEVSGDKISILLSELEDSLQEAADKISEWEDNEELEEEWEYNEV